MTNVVCVVQVLAVLYVTAQIGKFFHLLTILYIGEHALCLFTFKHGCSYKVYQRLTFPFLVLPALFVFFLWPLVYAKFQMKIDQAYGEANKQFEIYCSTIKERVLDKVYSKVKI